MLSIFKVNKMTFEERVKVKVKTGEVKPFWVRRSRDTRMQQDPLAYLCQASTSEVRAKWIDTQPSQTPTYAEELIGGNLSTNHTSEYAWPWPIVVAMVAKIKIHALIPGWKLNFGVKLFLMSLTLNISLDLG